MPVQVQLLTENANCKKYSQKFLLYYSHYHILYTDECSDAVKAWLKKVLKQLRMKKEVNNITIITNNSVHRTEHGQTKITQQI